MTVLTQTLVQDPYGVRHDAAMPGLTQALDPHGVAEQFAEHVPQLQHVPFNVERIRVSRYKPAKRCLIDYDLTLHHADGHPEPLTLIGKVRAKRHGKSGLRLYAAFRAAGFAEQSSDGISVPQTFGHVPAFGMWLQHKVSGTPLNEMLTLNAHPWIRQVARAADKIHRAGVPTERIHTMQDELRILHERLPQVADTVAGVDGRRIAQLLAACDAIGGHIHDHPPAPPTGIHRDFYADQCIISADRLWLIDFDLYCLGDPALDIGNFLGHIAEHSLRVYGDSAYLQPLENTLLSDYLALAGPHQRQAALVYRWLTLVRHIHLSTLFADRQHLTQPLLALCENTQHTLVA